MPKDELYVICLALRLPSVYMYSKFCQNLSKTESDEMSLSEK